MDTWTDFLFLRHGQTDWNLAGRFQGLSDTPLNDTGIAQAGKAAEVLAGQGIERIVASPLTRALKTAAIVAERLALPIDVDSGLKERGFGGLEGLVVNDVKREIGIAPSVPMAAHLPPDAEQWPDTVDRTRAVIGAWLERHPGQRILFVAHHGQFAALTETLIGARQEGQNSIPYIFQRDGRGWRVSETE